MKGHIEYKGMDIYIDIEPKDTYINTMPLYSTTVHSYQTLAQQNQRVEMTSLSVVSDV